MSDGPEGTKPAAGETAEPEVDFMAASGVSDVEPASEPEPTPAAAEPKQGAAEPQPPEPAPLPAAAPEPVAQPVGTSAEPVTPPAQPVAPPQPAEPPLAAPKALTQEEFLAKRTELQNTFASHYTLSEEDKLALQTEPENVLPKIAANVAVDVFEAASRIILGQIPQMIEQHLVTQRAATEARESFFRDFPALNKPEYFPTLRQVTQMYRQMNPQVPYADAIKVIGKHAMLMLGLSAEGTSPVNTPPPPPSRPATPLMPGSAPAAPAPVAAGNIFAELATFEPVEE